MPIIDFEGNKFNSKTKMCEYWETPYRIYESRIRKGWTEKEALTGIRYNKYEIIDPYGNIFKNATEFCNYYHLNKRTYEKRKQMGWTLIDIISNHKHKEIKDHIGNKFDNLQEMYDYWFTSANLFHSHTTSNLTFSERLTKHLRTILKQNPKIDSHLEIITFIDNDFYEINFDNKSLIWTFNQIADYYRQCHSKGV